MKSVTEIAVNLKHNSYSIHIGENTLTHVPDLLGNISDSRQVVIISVPPVADLYLNRLLKAFDQSWKTSSVIVDDGETSKSNAVLQTLYTKLIESGVERGAFILALGGGVVGDLAGYLAATYLRGIKLVQLPTSLLAQVDSSIGGKVGINHALGKNLIGAFYQPRMVISDVGLLKSLPLEEYICGMGEVVKYGIISEPQLFEMLESDLETVLTNESRINREIVEICARSKAAIVSADEKESGLRAVLNLGHTFGHVFENYFGYQQIKHGQAVLLGTKAAAAMALRLKILSEQSAERINTLVDRFGIRLPDMNELPFDDFFQIMQRDKKVRQGKINFILPTDIGKVVIRPIDDQDLIRESFEWVLEGNAR